MAPPTFREGADAGGAGSPACRLPPAPHAGYGPPRVHARGPHAAGAPYALGAHGPTATEAAPHGGCHEARQRPALHPFRDPGVPVPRRRMPGNVFDLGGRGTARHL
jgi:hypothetical protein